MNKKGENIFFEGIRPRHQPFPPSLMPNEGAKTGLSLSLSLAQTVAGI